MWGTMTGHIFNCGKKSLLEYVVANYHNHHDFHSILLQGVVIIGKGFYMFVVACLVVLIMQHMYGRALCGAS